MFIKTLLERAEFRPDRMGKVTLAQGDFLLAGLNCFEPGQEHAAHAHAGQDKLYVVLEGTGAVRIGDETQTLSTGDAAFAPSGVVHSVRNTGAGRLMLLTVLAPPPK